MKRLKNILISVLLVLTVSFYCGQGIINHYSQTKSMVNNNSCVQCLISSDLSLEEDVFFVQITHKLLPVFNIEGDIFSPVTDSFFLKLNSSIWQPPKSS